MNRKEHAQCMYYPKAVDEALNERFKEYDIKAVSELNIIHGNYFTTWRKDLKKEIHLQIQQYLAGFIAGNIELRDRLCDKSKWIGQ